MELQSLIPIFKNFKRILKFLFHLLFAFLLLSLRFHMTKKPINSSWFFFIISFCSWFYLLFRINSFISKFKYKYIVYLSFFSFLFMLNNFFIIFIQVLFLCIFTSFFFIFFFLFFQIYFPPWNFSEIILFCFIIIYYLF